MKVYGATITMGSTERLHHGVLIPIYCMSVIAPDGRRVDTDAFQCEDVGRIIRGKVLFG